MLACLKNPEMDVGMRIRDRQVDDHINLGVGKQLIHRTGFWNVVFLGAGNCPLHINIRTGDNFDNVEFFPRLELDRAYIAAADDANFKHEIGMWITQACG
jgi:hypothetical protein